MITKATKRERLLLKQARRRDRGKKRLTINEVRKRRGLKALPGRS